jgi:hypothetical protein
MGSLELSFFLSSSFLEPFFGFSLLFMDWKKAPGAGTDTPPLHLGWQNMQAGV